MFYDKIRSIQTTIFLFVILTVFDTGLGMGIMWRWFIWVKNSFSPQTDICTLRGTSSGFCRSQSTNNDLFWVHNQDMCPWIRSLLQCCFTPLAVHFNNGNSKNNNNSNYKESLKGNSESKKYWRIGMQNIHLCNLWMSVLTVLLNRIYNVLWLLGSNTVDRNNIKIFHTNVSFLQDLYIYMSLCLFSLDILKHYF